MSNSTRIIVSGEFRRLAFTGCAVALALAVTGCSTNTTRFDFPAFGLTNEEADNGSTNSIGPVPPEPIYNAESGGPAGTAEAAAGRNAARMPAPISRAELKPAAPPTGRTAGTTVTVRSGDTLYSLARRHDSSVKQIMAANGLSSGALRAGQKIQIPGKGPAQYTVRRGDSLYGIAQRYHVHAGTLAHVNNISDPAAIRAGQVLKLPSSGSRIASLKPISKPAARTVGRSTGERRTATAAPKPAPAPAAKPAPREAAKPAAAPRATTLIAKSEPAAITAKANTEPRFRWPVRGRVIAGFGPKGDGAHNDGINLAVPMGTSVHAAEDGVVAYAGNELKGYGKLILVRHSGNWVSAYAHSSEILVKRGQTIRRGQVIAKAGQTGGVVKPQLHFELRRGSRPVDPVKHLPVGVAGL